MEIKAHLRARALVYHNGRFLVLRMKNGSHSFLQGGHIEIGESIIEALKREMMEECGRMCSVKEYLGAIENTWIEDGIKHWEINHIFHVEIPDLDKDFKIESLEEDYEFIWATPDEFEKINLLPLPIRELMKKWAGGDRTTWWASTFYGV